MAARFIMGAESRALDHKARWELLSPYLKEHGSGCMSYSTLQEDLDYFLVDGVGYIAFFSIKHPLLAPFGRRFVVGDPIVPRAEFKRVVKEFLDAGTKAVFYQISRAFAEALHEGFGIWANELGVEWDLPLQSYSLKGKEKSQIRQWVNKAKREGVEVFEVHLSELNVDEVRAISEDWLKRKGTESKIIIRPMSFRDEPDVRHVFARKDGRLIGFTGYDPLYRDGKLVGFYHDHVRTLDDAPHGSTDLMNVYALEKFKEEGLETVTLGLSPLSLPGDHDLGYSRTVKFVFALMREHCGFIYPFKGNYFHKSRYGGDVRKVYIASSSGHIFRDFMASSLCVC
jgi:phosphatidylglycerol lysyltransferase